MHVLFLFTGGRCEPKTNGDVTMTLSVDLEDYRTETYMYFRLMPD